MKKRTTTLLLASSLLVLGGCGDANATVSSSNDAIFTVGSTNVTKGEVYDSLLSQYGSSTTISEVQKAVMNIEVPVDEEMQKTIDEKFAEVKESSGDDFLTTLQNYGYKSEEDYKERGLAPKVQEDALVKKYATDDFEALASKYIPMKAEIAQFTTPEDAAAALEAAKGGTSLTDAGAANNVSTTYTGEEKVVSDTSALPKDLVNAMKEADTSAGPVLTENVITGTDTKGAVTYYIVRTVSNNYEDYKDEAIDGFVGISEVQSSALTYYFKLHNFGVYDLTIRDGIKSTNEELLGE